MITSLPNPAAFSWAASRGGKWHIATSDTPTFVRAEPTLCGDNFVPLNVTWRDAPPTNDHHVCGRCRAAVLRMAGSAS